MDVETCLGTVALGPDVGVVAQVKPRPACRRTTESAAADERLRDLFVDHAGVVRRYAYRCGIPDDDLDDVVAEVFLVAWRRLEMVPPSPGSRLWLLGVARRVVAKQRTKSWRRYRLARRLGESARSTATDMPLEAVALREAVRRLPQNEQDAVLLVEWEGLTHDEAAIVMRCSPNASRLRLHSAKGRLRHMLVTDEDEVPPEGRRKECADGR